MEIFDIFSYSFFYRALIMSIITGISCGIIGVWLLLLNISFIGITIAHFAFAGAIIGLFFNINPLLLGFTLCILYTLIIEPLSKKAKVHNNVSMSILFSFSIGIAFLFIGLLKENISQAFTFMFGNILITTYTDIICSFIVMAVIMLFLFATNKGLIAIFFNREISNACAIPETLIYYLMLILVCATISLNIKSVGGLLIYSLISLPATTAYQLTRNIKTLYLLSSIFAVLSCVIGLFITSVIPLPTGATIIVVSCLIFFVSLFFQKK